MRECLAAQRPVPRRVRRCANISEQPAAINANPIANDQRRSKPVNGSVLALLGFEDVPLSEFAATPLEGLELLDDELELELLLDELLSLDGEVPLEGVVVVVGVVVGVVVAVVVVVL
jgi:hypothetical protein